MPLNRRSFLKSSGLSFIPGVLASLPVAVHAGQPEPDRVNASEPVVNFFYDGEWFVGPGYWEQLQQYHHKQAIKADVYGRGGAVEELEKRMAGITGKEKAVFMPSGTMANQFAIAVLSGENTKVFVQDNSHVFRDEADAAQSVFNKRLMPLTGNKTYFTADELKAAIENLDREEVFKSGIGCVSIENPVRRSDGRMVPIEEIKKIREYCQQKNIPMHLDGARIFMTAAWSGISIKEYAAYFDTVYISLYKYLGASAGAILCGPKTVIDKMPHLMKIHGGTMFGNWLNAAMALHRLDGFEERLQKAIAGAKNIFAELNKVNGVSITSIDGGTNIYRMKFPAGTIPQKFFEELLKYQVRMPRPGEKGEALITVNETLLYREPDYIVNAVKEALTKSRS
jgi:threonine aldolase